eukprot:SAG31_NODE_29945_length_387_cov_6.767361_1_plen_34_part_10
MVYKWSWSKFSNFGHTTYRILGDQATNLVPNFGH